MILAFATKGSETNEESRLRTLLSGVDATFVSFDKRAKLRSGWQTLRTLLRERPTLAVMEGTGIAGGAACLIARWVAGVPFVFSSGDAVGPFVAAIRPMLGPAFAIYERLLCRSCAGFIGWTPYLVGRALTLGAPRGVTAAGWSPFGPADASARARARAAFGFDDDTIVFGIVGSLFWNPRYRYCYGAELVRAIARVPSERKVAVLIGGGGSGMPHLQKLAVGMPEGRVRLLGDVPADRVPECLAAMDVASLPQSVDGVGSFRYTTKLSEILAAGLPVVTGGIPLAYDLDDGWLWRLPGRTPWDEQYVDSLAALMSTLTFDAIEKRARLVPQRSEPFDVDRQVRRVTAFVQDILDARPKAVKRSMVTSPVDRENGPANRAFARSDA